MPRYFLFGLLYFSEGAPIGFLWWALPTILRVQGLAVERITALTALLVLPWTLKFLAAPLVDLGRSWGLKHWVAGAQIGMGLCLLPLTRIDPLVHLDWWTGFLLAHAICAAMQDVAIDALAIASVPPADRGRVNSAMQIGMLAGRGLFGGVSIWLAKVAGLGAVVASLIVAIWLSLVVLWNQAEEPAPRQRPLWPALRAAAGRATTWLGLGFALTAEAAFKATGGLAGPMLIDHQVSQEATAAFFSLGVVGAMMVGSLIGGRLADQRSRYRAVGTGLVFTVAMVFGLGLLERWGLRGPVLMVALAGVYLSIGVFTVSAYALLMDLTEPTLGATQFSAFMAATNACEAWSVALAGRLAGQHGYGLALMAMACAGLLGFGFLFALSRRAQCPE
ncbi:MAG: hypothetical protein KC910_02195 [Candidatus Eremiobacteraeota bacterium]|nr:hypothetical protein [Candidatus Eremiobacteraeota bacterium]